MTLPRPAGGAPSRRTGGARLLKAARTLKESGLPQTVRGIYLVPPHGKWLATGKSRAMLKNRALPLEGWSAILSEGRAWGLVRFKGGREYVRDAALAKSGHDVSPQEAVQWWPRSKTLWLYRVDQVRRFTRPVKVRGAQGMRVVVPKVALPASTRVSEAVGKEVVQMSGYTFGRFEKAREMSLDDLRTAVQNALPGGPEAVGESSPYVRELYPGYAILAVGDGKYEKRAYSVDAEGNASVETTGVPVAQIWVEVAAA